MLRDFLRPHRRALVGLAGLHAAQSAATLVLPALNAAVIDDGVLAADDSAIRATGGLMLVVTGAQVLIAVLATYVGAKISAAFGRELRAGLFHSVSTFSAREVNLLGAPSLITRVTNDVQQVQMFVAALLTVGMAAPMTVLGGVVLSVREDAALSARLSLSLVALAVTLGVLIARLVPVFTTAQDRLDSTNGVLREQIAGARVVRAFVREPDEIARFAGVNDGLTETSLLAGRLNALVLPVLVLIINVSSVAVLWFGAESVVAGDVSIGSLVAFLTYFTLMLVAVLTASGVALMAPRAAVCAGRIVEVLGMEPSVQDPGAATAPIPSAPLLEVHDAAFRYPGAAAPVLERVTFTLRGGETLAVVGSTGAGKTTLAGLVTRLIDVTDGEVRLDGVDVRDLDRRHLADRIGLVPQTAHLFSGTIATNLRFGKPDATDDELWEALETAQAADFVRSMVGGLDASVTQGGRNLSGGQRQRIAIARAVVKRPGLYVFDDAFSALDAATDARLRAALQTHAAGSAFLVVAQRVTTVMHADHILVLDDGRPAGIGRHDELVATCSAYAEIVESQLDGTAA